MRGCADARARQYLSYFAFFSGRDAGDAIARRSIETHLFTERRRRIKSDGATGEMGFTNPEPPDVRFGVDTVEKVVGI
jgi:hypothetical protein